jgi:hypothetical protein
LKASSHPFGTLFLRNGGGDRKSQSQEEKCIGFSNGYLQRVGTMMVDDDEEDCMQTKTEEVVRRSIDEAEALKRLLSQHQQQLVGDISGIYLLLIKSILIKSKSKSILNNSPANKVN